MQGGAVPQSGGRASEPGGELGQLLSNCPTLDPRRPPRPCYTGRKSGSGVALAVPRRLWFFGVGRVLSR